MADDDLIMGDDYGDPEESGEESNPIGGESESGGSGSSESGSSEPSSKDINTVPLISDNDLRSGIKVLISDATGAIKRASISDIIALIAGRNAGGHNSFYRGDQIGTGVTNAQWSAIYNGTFDDMFIGDYWLINNIKWRIAAFDYWRNFGGPNTSDMCLAHHIVVVPDVSLVQSKINSTRITTGAYYGSDFYLGNNGLLAKTQIQSTIQSAFGVGRMLPHKELYTSAMTDNNATSSTYAIANFDLMTEHMVYGSSIYGSVKTYDSNSETTFGLGSFDYSQLPLFALRREHIALTEHWWLRDPAGAKEWCMVMRGGQCTTGYPNNENGIRPEIALYASSDPLAS